MISSTTRIYSKAHFSDIAKIDIYMNMICNQIDV